MHVSAPRPSHSSIPQRASTGQLSSSVVFFLLPLQRQRPRRHPRRYQYLSLGRCKVKKALGAIFNAGVRFSLQPSLIKLGENV
jgi:hypothetical protein